MQPDNVPSAQTQQASGSFLDVIGALSKGISGVQTAQSGVGAAKFNAGVAGQNAAMIGQETAQNEQSLRLYQQQKIGQERANLAEAGTGGLSSGSNAGVINQSEVNANMQALMERYKGTVARTSELNKQNLDNYRTKVEDQNATNDIVNMGLSTTASMLRGFGRYVNGGF